MIPRVKTWNIKVWSDDGKIVAQYVMLAPNKALVRIGFRMDYPRHWGQRFTISLAKMKELRHT